MTKTKIDMNDCSDFASLTHSTYKHAGCAGCSHFLIFSGGEIECQVGHTVARKKRTCKEFGTVRLVIRNG